MIPPTAAARHDSKALVERFWLEYTLVWCGVMGFVMVTGLGSVWGDPELMVLGVTLGAGAYAYPRYRGSRTPAVRRSAAKWREFTATLGAMYWGVTALSFVMHYIATPFFFDVLHMRYGFNVSLRIDRNPVFLYPLTIAYFSTYCATGCMAFRWLCRRCGAAPDVTILGTAALCAMGVSFALAFFETLLNANPFIADLFCYDDNIFALTFGSAAYGLGFVFSLPVWMHAIPDDVPAPAEGERRVLCMSIGGSVAAELAHGAGLWALRHYVAPVFTTVVENSPPQGGCLTTRWSLF